MQTVVCKHDGQRRICVDGKENIALATTNRMISETFPTKEEAVCRFASRLPIRDKHLIICYVVRR